MIIRSRAPVRLELGGGGTDMKPYDVEHGGVVLNATINKYIYGTLIKRENREINLVSADYKKTSLFYDIKELKYNNDLDLMKAAIKVMNPEFGFELFLRSDVPPNTGLGSSATAAISMLGLFNHTQNKKLNNYELAETAFRLEEEELENAGGRQDQYATVFGGLNLMEFKGNHFVRVNGLKLKKDSLLELEKHFVLAYIGKREESGDIIKGQQESYTQEEKKLCLDKLKSITYDMYDCLHSEDFYKFGNLLNKEWDTKVNMNPVITTDRIEAIRKIGETSGAIGSRLMGAGRGGHIIFYCDSNKEHKVVEKLQEKGISVVDFSFDYEGLQTWEVKL